jgi:hypothetical protein
MSDEDKDGKRGPETQLVYECAVCQNSFDHPGMCQACHILLKPKGE